MAAQEGWLGARPVPCLLKSTGLTAEKAKRVANSDFCAPQTKRCRYLRDAPAFS